MDARKRTGRVGLFAAGPGWETSLTCGRCGCVEHVWGIEETESAEPVSTDSSTPLEESTVRLSESAPSASPGSRPLSPSAEAARSGDVDLPGKKVCVSTDSRRTHASQGDSSAALSEPAQRCTRPNASLLRRPPPRGPADRGARRRKLLNFTPPK